MDGSFRLIDLDAGVMIGEFAGEKTSTAFVPPDMTYDDDGVVRFRNPGCGVDRCVATPALDFWALGCILYRAVARKPLFEADDADNIRSPRELARLHLWGPGQIGDTLREVDASLRDATDVSDKQRVLTCDLIGWMLQRDPSKRPQSAEDLLSHALFFAGTPDGQQLSCGKTLMSELHLAAALAPVEHVRSLIAAGVGSALVSTDHVLLQTPLHVAAIAMREDVIHVLLPSKPNSGESTTDAGASGRSEIPRPTELAQDAVPDATDACGDTAVHAVLMSAVMLASNAECMEASLRVLRVLAPMTSASLPDSQGRTIFDVGCASPIKPVRDFFSALLKEQVDKKRCDLYRETVLCGEEVVVPWGLPKRAFQAWLREQAGEKYKGGLKELIDAMTEVDGLTALSAWVEIGFDGKSANCGKLNLSKIKEHLNVKDVKNASFQQLANLLGQLALGKRAINTVLQPGGLSYHKAVLQSCEKRSLLSDYIWCKTVGEGAFGRAHLCKYDVCVSRVTFVVVASSVNLIVFFFGRTGTATAVSSA